VLSEREQAAVEYAERLAKDHTSIDEAFLTQMRQWFTEAELVELGFTVAGFVMLGRLHQTFGLSPAKAQYHASLEHDPQPTSGTT
jgi:alkylhydroperoxidase family enzyme